MTILPILTEPNPLLRKRSEEVAKDLIPQLKILIEDMIATMKAAKGIGIAAPQVGKSLRVIVVNTDDQPTVLINPVITRFSWRKSIDEEGCLSVPGEFGLVKRAESIRVEALNELAEPLKFKAKGLLARVVQHEVDHIDGILFIDKVIKYTNNVRL